MFALRGNRPDEYIANCCMQTGRLYTSIFRHHTFEKLEDTDKNFIKPSVAGLGPCHHVDERCVEERNLTFFHRVHDTRAKESLRHR
jgi:hypothetical protein